MSKYDKESINAEIDKFLEATDRAGNDDLFSSFVNVHALYEILVVISMVVGFFAFIIVLPSIGDRSAHLLPDYFRRHFAPVSSKEPNTYEQIPWYAVPLPWYVGRFFYVAGLGFLIWLVS